jgi:clan AA aspartic protease (TIGR02281 family)
MNEDRMRRVGPTIGLIVMLLFSVGAAPYDLDQAGRAAYTRGDYETAERVFREAIARTPNDAVLRYHRAAALTKLGRWNEAIDEYERVLQLRPSEEIAAASRGALNALMPLAGRTATRRADADETTIALERSRGGWITEVVLNDTRKSRFLVDTGASLTVLTPELADELGIKPPRRGRVVRLQTLSGETEGPIVTIPLVRVGDLEARDVIAVIHEIPDLDGILGNTFLARYSVTLDARRGLLTVRRK